jgi:ABC-type multidrug transport system fused ATPase/permease subunit
MDNPVEIATSNRLSEHSKANLIDLEPNDSPSILQQDGIAKNKIVESKLQKKNKDIANAGKLTTEEKRETGSVGAKYYLYYMKSAGMILSLMCIFFFGISIFLRMTVDWWVGQWQEGKYDEDITKDNQLIIYLLLGLGCLVFLCLRAITLGFVTQLASVNIFKSIVWNILRRPMSFFDTTPSGVIINRCTNDVDQLDYNIPWMMSFFLNTAFDYAGALILTAVVSPVVIVFIVIALIIVSRSFTKYIRTTIELKRLVQLSAAPVISLSSELIEGVTIVRNYNKRKDLLKKYQ